jgi:hypothetical protein
MQRTAENILCSQTRHRGRTGGRTLHTTFEINDPHEIS